MSSDSLECLIAEAHQWMTSIHAARFLNKSTDSIRLYVRGGRLRAVKIGNTQLFHIVELVRFHRDELGKRRPRGGGHRETSA